jgi:ribonuclease HI
MKKLTEQELQILIILLWMNWRERNSAQHGDAVPLPNIIFEKGMNYFSGLLEVQAMRNTTGALKNGRSRTGDSMVRWKVPFAGFLKLNCDGAFNVALGQFGGGAVLRDEFGALIAAMGEAYTQKGTVCLNELLAIKLGLEMILERRCGGVEVESDSLEAVRLVNMDEQCFNVEGVVVEEICKLMFLLHISSIHHVPRDENKAAHSVAVNVAREHGRFSWLEVGPPWLMSVILDDMPVTVGSARDMSSSQPSIEELETRYSQSPLYNLII